jgi:hypothetical protein
VVQHEGEARRQRGKTKKLNTFSLATWNPETSIRHKNRTKSSPVPISTDYISPIMRSSTALAEVMRLNKIMSQHLGLCSRREADHYIACGWVRVNGAVASTLGQRFDTVGCTVQLLAPSSHQQQQATVILNKPLGIVSSQPEVGHTPAVKLLTADREYRRQHRTDAHRSEPRARQGWGVAGRLDVNSTGLLVLTHHWSDIDNGEGISAAISSSN